VAFYSGKSRKIVNKVNSTYVMIMGLYNLYRILFGKRNVGIVATTIYQFSSIFLLFRQKTLIPCFVHSDKFCDFVRLTSKTRSLGQCLHTQVSLLTCEVIILTKPRNNIFLVFLIGKSIQNICSEASKSGYQA